MLKPYLVFFFSSSVLFAQGDFSSIVNRYSSKEYSSGKDAPETKLSVQPSINEETRTLSWFQSYEQKLTDKPLSQNTFTVYESISQATFDLNFVAQRESLEYNTRRLYDEYQLKTGNERAQRLYNLQEQIEEKLSKTITGAYSGIMADVLRSRGYKVEIREGKVVIDDAVSQEFNGNEHSFEFAGQNMNVGELGHAILVSSSEGKEKPKLLFRFTTITGGLNRNGAGHAKYNASYRFSWSTEEGVYLLNGQYKHTGTDGRVKYSSEMPVETYEIFGTRFGPIYRLRDALNLHGLPEKEIPSRVCTYEQVGENNHLFNNNKPTLVTSVAGNSIKQIGDLKEFAESDYLRDRRIPITIYTPRKYGQVVPVSDWHYRSLQLHPDFHAMQVARDKRVEEERLKEKARQQVKNQEHLVRLEMDRKHKEELYKIAKQREKERYERQLKIIRKAQQEFIPELAKLAKEEPRMALSLYKYIYDHVPQILTTSQQVLLGKIHYANENFVINSRPFNVNYKSSDRPLQINELSTKYHSVGIAKGEMVITNFDYDIRLIIPIESPDALVKKLADGNSWMLTLAELFETSRFGGGVLAKEYAWFDVLNKKPIIDDGYRRLVLVENHQRPYGRKYYPPAIFHSKIFQGATFIAGAGIVAANGIALVEELSKAEFDFEQEKPKDEVASLEVGTFTHVKVQQTDSKTGVVTRQYCHYKASNKTRYRLVYTRRLKNALVGYEYQGWRMCGEVFHPHVSGYDHHKRFKTKEELAAYIESLIQK